MAVFLALLLAVGLSLRGVDAEILENLTRQ